MPTPYEDLNIDQLFHLAGSYSNYIMDFDYEMLDNQFQFMNFINVIIGN